jgi:hypothetical protein
LRVLRQQAGSRGVQHRVFRGLGGGGLGCERGIGNEGPARRDDDTTSGQPGGRAGLLPLYPHRPRSPRSSVFAKLRQQDFFLGDQLFEARLLRGGFVGREILVGNEDGTGRRSNARAIARALRTPTTTAAAAAAADTGVAVLMMFGVVVLLDVPLAADTRTKLAPCHHQPRAHAAGNPVHRGHTTPRSVTHRDHRSTNPTAFRRAAPRITLARPYVGEIGGDVTRYFVPRAAKVATNPVV